jgi:hypothetical protein
MIYSYNGWFTNPCYDKFGIIRKINEIFYKMKNGETEN